MGRERALMPDQQVNEDKYALGMIHSPSDEEAKTANYDRYQYSLFEKYVHGRVLEVGAGTGRITDLIIRDGHFDELAISEPSPYFFGRLEDRFRSIPKTRLIQGEVADIVRTDRGYFDVVFSVHVMEHIENDRAFVGQQLELLRPGGTLIILVPALQFLYSELDKNIGHFRRYTKSSIRALFNGTPGRIEKLFYSNFIGVLGSLYFSKLKKVQYQSDETHRQRFFKIYQIFSQYFVPGIQMVERVIPAPIGLNLTVIATRRKDGTGKPA